jgi:hypothetical protein
MEAQGALPWEGETMKYLLMICRAEEAWTKLSDSERAALSGEFKVFTERLRTDGHYLGGEALQPVATATTVRVRNGKTLTTDGPFAETREQLGGFYLVEAKDLDQAIGLAAGIPIARTGSIEVRPILTIP